MYSWSERYNSSVGYSSTQAGNMAVSGEGRCPSPKSSTTRGPIVEMITHRLIATFHHVVSEQSGNDVTINRAKTMVALAALTWPGLGIDVRPHYFSSGRMWWKSDDFDSMNIGGSFRRDPVGDDASIILEDVDPDHFIMLEEMEECASFIPLFGRQSLERFNQTLAELYSHHSNGTPLPLPGSDASRSFTSETEYRRLYQWLVDHGTISPEGKWHAGDHDGN